MQLSRLRQHLISVEEPYDAEALRACQREDTLLQVLDELPSNKSQSHKAQADEQVSDKGFNALYEIQMERLIFSYVDIFFNDLVQLHVLTSLFFSPTLQMHNPFNIPQPLRNPSRPLIKSSPPPFFPKKPSPPLRNSFLPQLELEHEGLDLKDQLEEMQRQVVTVVFFYYIPFLLFYFRSRGAVVASETSTCSSRGSIPTTDSDVMNAVCCESVHVISGQYVVGVPEVLPT